MARWIALALWGAGVVAGFAVLWRYAATPGPATVAPLRWPATAGLTRTPGHWTLLMFVHPRCPCTRSSLAELERLQARLQGRWEVWVVWPHPTGADPHWGTTAILRRASMLPGTKVIEDQGGRLTALFGAQTSGESLLYAPDGRLAFHGGITPARGHEGDNPGREAIAALVQGACRLGSHVAFSRAYGCPLEHPLSARATSQEAER